MEVYRTEDEQVEAIKHWWKDNYKALLGGVIIGIAILWGGNVWKQQRESTQTAASAAYMALLQDLERGDLATVVESEKKLREEYGDTAYAAMAALATARAKLDQADFTGAEADLRWALEQAEEPALQQVIRLRLARLLNAQGQHQAALDSLNGIEPGTYRAIYEELKGDIYVELGDSDKARTAYAAALVAQQSDNVNPALLQMKLDNLGTAADEAGK